jgi:hypothetical protein
MVHFQSQSCTLSPDPPAAFQNILTEYREDVNCFLSFILLDFTSTGRRSSSAFRFLAARVLTLSGLRGATTIVKTAQAALR